MFKKNYYACLWSVDTFCEMFCVMCMFYLFVMASGRLTWCCNTERSSTWGCVHCICCPPPYTTNCSRRYCPAWLHSVSPSLLFLSHIFFIHFIICIHQYQTIKFCTFYFKKTNVIEYVKPFVNVTFDFRWLLVTLRDNNFFILCSL